MPNEITLPTREMAFDLLKKLKVPYHVRRHSLAVADKALEIASKITKVNVNIDLVEVGAILHDIGRAVTHGFEHAVIGGKILRERGYPTELSRICETHILGGLDKFDAKEVGLEFMDYIPQTIEEKIICLADKNMAGTKEVSIEQRFQKWFSKYGKTKILIKAKKGLKKFKKK